MMRYMLILFGCLIFIKSKGQQNLLEFVGEPEQVSQVNSPYDERFIALHPDGLQMLITRLNHPQNIGDKSNPGDLWLSKYDSIWINPVASINIDSKSLITPLGFVNNGKLLFYNSTRFDKGIYKGEVGLADFSEQKITNKRIAEIKYFRNTSPQQSGSISADGKHIVLSIEGNTSIGVEDLYVCHLQPDGIWSAPRNLGYQINTAFQEYTPFLAPDNATLIFASNGREGFGSFDLYVSTRLDDSWQNWSVPKNLGEKVNTQGAEVSFVYIPGSEYAYYSSTTNSDGYGDIKRIKFKSNIENNIVEAEQLVLIEKVNKEIVIQVLDESTKLPLEIMIEVITDTATTLVNSPLYLSGDFVGDITVNTQASGYMNKQVTYTSSQLMSSDTLSVNIIPLTVGSTIQLNHVLFYQGTPNIVEGSEKELDRIVELLNENPRMKIDIKGHTDGIGDPVLNLELSRARVKTVQNYLIRKGIDFRRIPGTGFGGNSPIAPNDTEENRRLNRRVEFTITDF